MEGMLKRVLWWYNSAGDADPPKADSMTTQRLREMLKQAKEENGQVKP
jgi:hypothetical protein